MIESLIRLSRNQHPDIQSTGRVLLTMKRYALLGFLAIGLLLAAPISYDTGIEKGNVVNYQMVDEVNDYFETNAEVAGTGLLTDAETVQEVVIESFGKYPEETKYPERRTKTSSGYQPRLFRPPNS